MAETKPVQSLLRGIDLLQILCATPDGLKLQDLAERIDLKVPTTHNLLKSLCLRDLVEKRPGSVYRIGAGMLKMTARLTQAQTLTHAEAAVLALGAHPCRPFVNYCEIRSSQIPLRLRVSPEAPGIVERPAGRTNGLYNSASGLVALAFAPEDQALSLKESAPFEETGIGIWKTRERLENAVAEVRQRGVAVFPWEGAELLKIAAPVRGTADLTILGMAVPLKRAGAEREKEALAELVRNTAEKLAQTLRQS